jgi:cell wall-associated NlpC family hydrolase
VIPRADVVAAARSWLRTPYQHQRRLKGVAVDCAGLVIGVAREVGAVPPDFDITGYSRQPDGVSLMQHCERHMRRIELGDMQPGDVIVTRFDLLPCHFAILGDHLHGGLSMIHALCTRTGRGKVIEHRLDPTNRARIIAAYGLPGVA